MEMLLPKYRKMMGLVRSQNNSVLLTRECFKLEPNPDKDGSDGNHGREGEL